MVDFAKPRIPSDARLGRTECECMNALQDHGVISDNAVHWPDVGNVKAALDWLRAHPKEVG